MMLQFAQLLVVQDEYMVKRIITSNSNGENNSLYFSFILGLGSNITDVMWPV